MFVFMESSSLISLEVAQVQAILDAKEFYGEELMLFTKAEDIKQASLITEIPVLLALSEPYMHVDCRAGASHMVIDFIYEVYNFLKIPSHVLLISTLHFDMLDKRLRRVVNYRYKVLARTSHRFRLVNESNGQVVKGTVGVHNLWNAIVLSNKHLPSDEENTDEKMRSLVEWDLSEEE